MLLPRTDAGAGLVHWFEYWALWHRDHAVCGVGGRNSAISDIGLTIESTGYLIIWFWVVSGTSLTQSKMVARSQQPVLYPTPSGSIVSPIHDGNGPAAISLLAFAGRLLLAEAVEKLCQRPP